MSTRRKAEPGKQSKLVIDHGEQAEDLSLDEGLSLDDGGGLGSLAGEGDSLDADADSLEVDEPPETARKEHSLPQDLAELQDTFMSRAQREQKRFELVTDSEYWVCLCFQSREQKEAFLAAKGWLTDTNDSDKYLDGLEIAAREGIALPEAQVPFVKEKPDAALNNISLPLKRRQ